MRLIFSRSCRATQDALIKRATPGSFQGPLARGLGAGGAFVDHIDLCAPV